MPVSMAVVSTGGEVSVTETVFLNMCHLPAPTRSCTVATFLSCIIATLKNTPFLNEEKM